MPLALVETEPDLLVFESLGDDTGPGSDFGQIATDNPDQLFAFPVRLFWEYPNVATFSYASHEGSFLAGVAAAGTSQTGVVGFIGGQPLVIDGFRAGFEAGARFARPDIQVLNTYLVGDGFEVFTVGADAAAVTDDLIDRGADVIYNASGVAGTPILSAIAARDDRHVWMIGVDVDESLKAPKIERDHVLTSMLQRHDLAIVEIVRQFDAGDLEPGEVIVGNVVNGVMGLVTPGNMSDPVVEAVEEARQALIDEAFSVPELPDRSPIEAVGTDYAVRIELATSGCVVEDFEPVVGDIVRFDVENQFSEESGIAV